MTDTEHRLDELAKAVADSRQTRRGVVKVGLGFVAAAVAGVLPGRAGGHHDPDHDTGSSACAHFCKSFPPTQRDECLHACKEGPCFRDPANICPGSDPVKCCPGSVGGITACCGIGDDTTCCNRPAGQLCCPTQARCLDACTAPRVPDLVNCQCVCPVGTRECTAGGTCCPTAQACCGNVCCPPDQECGPGNVCRPKATCTGCNPATPCISLQLCGSPPTGQFCACFPRVGSGACHCGDFPSNLCSAYPSCTTQSDCPGGAVCVASCCPTGVCMTPCGSGSTGAGFSAFASGSEDGPRLTL